MADAKGQKGTQDAKDEDEDMTPCCSLLGPVLGGKGGGKTPGCFGWILKKMFRKML